MIRVELERKSGDYGFVAVDEFGNNIQTDSSPANGGLNFGIRPMQLLLMALGSCSAIDIVSILKKQKQEITGFRIEINGVREEGKEPSLWKNISLHFYLDGIVDTEKASRACSLSLEKYCSVAETLRRGGTIIDWKVTVNK
ncbi:MAG TPA: OsmC family protein [Flavisolibacter sp.]|nr:OsmC family protein [Flavisolibacter sp.]